MQSVARCKGRLSSRQQVDVKRRAMQRAQLHTLLAARRCAAACCAASTGGCRRPHIFLEGAARLHLLRLHMLSGRLIVQKVHHAFLLVLVPSEQVRAYHLLPAPGGRLGGRAAVGITKRWCRAGLHTRAPPGALHRGSQQPAASLEERQLARRAATQLGEGQLPFVVQHLQQAVHISTMRQVQGEHSHPAAPTATPHTQAAPHSRMPQPKPANQPPAPPRPRALT